MIVYDADSYCGLDLGAALRIPVVARFGTGLRDAFTSPGYVPVYGNGAASPRTYMQRLRNLVTLAVSRYVVSPLLLPNLYSRHRKHFLELADKHQAERGLQVAGPRSADAVRYDLLLDGIPSLYNTHWALEYPRPVMPWEHVIGHTTDYQREASKPLPQHVQAWLDAEPGIPVVYVAMGTLSVMPLDWLDGFAAALERAAARASLALRVLWVVPRAQQQMLPRHLFDYSTRWQEAVDADNASMSVHFGDILLVDWVPQVTALTHPSVHSFVTHGGMNSVGDATYARSPMVCMPLFSDQPDNCARIDDRGLGRLVRTRVSSGGVRPDEFASAVSDLLLHRSHYVSNLERAWLSNVAAGGAAQAVHIIEATAAAGYGGHALQIPEVYQRPWYQAADIDVWTTLLVLLVALCVVARRVVGCCSSCCGLPGKLSGCSRGAAKGKLE